MSATMENAPQLVERVDELAEHAILGLRDALSAAGTRRVVVVLDSMSDDAFLVKARQLAFQTREVHLTAATQRHGPYLVDIPDETQYESWVNDSIRLATLQAVQPARWNHRIRSVCAWLITTRSLDELSRAVSRLSHFTDSKGVRRTLRFWDPRSMQHVRKWCGRPVSDSCLPGVSWGLIDSFGRWHLLPSPEQEEVSVTLEEEKLRELSLINASLQRLNARGLIHGPDVWPVLQSSLNAGQRLGLTDDDDLVWFAADRVRLRAPLERAKALSKLFSTVKQGKGRYIRAIADYDDTEWRSVVESIPKADPSKGDMP